MSVDLVVYLARSAMPSPLQWAKAISEANFPVALDTQFDADEHTGFLPCKFRGKLSGFEYYSDRLREKEREEVGAPKTCDFLITFVTHSLMHELATSFIAAGVLCHISGGLFVDPQSGDSYTSEYVLDMVRSNLAAIEQDLK